MSIKRFKSRHGCFIEIPKKYFFKGNLNKSNFIDFPAMTNQIKETVNDIEWRILPMPEIEMFILRLKVARIVELAHYILSRDCKPPKNCALNINHIKVMFCHDIRRGGALMKVMYHRMLEREKWNEEGRKRLIDASLNVCQHNWHDLQSHSNCRLDNESHLFQLVRSFSF